MRALAGLFRKRALIALALPVVAAWIAVVWALGDGEDDRISERTTLPVVRNEVLYTYDIFDKRLLVGYSDAVFVGRVIRRVGQEPIKTTIPNDEEGPQTQFEVKVLEIVEAEGPAKDLAARQTVVVNQIGGKDHKRGVTVAVEAVVPGSDGTGESTGPPPTVHVPDKPLAVGREYMFATRIDRVQGWHSLTAQPAANVLLESEDQRRKLVSEFGEAVEDRGAAPRVVGG